MLLTVATLLIAAITYSSNDTYSSSYLYIVTVAYNSSAYGNNAHIHSLCSNTNGNNSCSNYLWQQYNYRQQQDYL